MRTGASEMVYLGDFFDRPELDSMEITALQEVRWNALPHTFIIGNHEASTASLELNSTNVLQGLGFRIVSEPTAVGRVLFLPYATEADRKPLASILGDCDVVFSHNDIAGINYGYGGFVSKHGYPLSDLESLKGEGRLRLFVNGHLHNHWKSGCLVNLGNLTGQNFNEDATKYPHVCMLLDLKTLEAELIENPMAFNFYKLSYPDDFPVSLKANAVVSAKCVRGMEGKAREAVVSSASDADGIVALRLTVEPDGSLGTQGNAAIPKADHLGMFRQYALSELSGMPFSEDEISEVLK